MKIVVIRRRGGHEVVAASPKIGINSITGEGLKEAIATRRWWPTSPICPHSKTGRCWNSSRLPAMCAFERRRRGRG